MRPRCTKRKGLLIISAVKIAARGCRREVEANIIFEIFQVLECGPGVESVVHQNCCRNALRFVIAGASEKAAARDRFGADQ
jgi:hypothetical protein